MVSLNNVMGTIRRWENSIISLRWRFLEIPHNKIWVSWGVLFKGLGVQKGTQTPCWLRPWPAESGGSKSAWLTRIQWKVNHWTLVFQRTEIAFPVMRPACHLDTQNTVFWQFGHPKVYVRICWIWLFLEDRRCRSCSVTFIRHTKQYLA